MYKFLSHRHHDNACFGVIQGIGTSSSYPPKKNAPSHDMQPIPGRDAPRRLTLERSRPFHGPPSCAPGTQPAAFQGCNSTTAADGLALVLFSLARTPRGGWLVPRNGTDARAAARMRPVRPGGEVQTRRRGAPTPWHRDSAPQIAPAPAIPRCRLKHWKEKKEMSLTTLARYRCTHERTHARATANLSMSANASRKVARECPTEYSAAISRRAHAHTSRPLGAEAHACAMALWHGSFAHAHARLRGDEIGCELASRIFLAPSTNLDGSGWRAHARRSREASGRHILSLHAHAHRRRRRCQSRLWCCCRRSDSQMRPGRRLPAA
jgi:hypothetical protein